MISIVSLWALIVAQIGHDWGFYIMASDLPKYMNDVLYFLIKPKNELHWSLPYLLMWVVSIATGILSDYIVLNGWLSLTDDRKDFTVIGTIALITINH